MLLKWKRVRRYIRLRQALTGLTRHFQERLNEKVKKILHLALILAVCFGQIGCQTKPKPKPLTQYSDEELVYLYKNGAVEPPRKPGYDWSNIGVDTAKFIVMIPVWLALLFTSESAVQSDQAQKRNPGI